MNKEKIILGNGKELPYDSIGISGNQLVICFAGGNAADLEKVFRTAGQNNLEEIRQVDAEGNLQTTHRLYDIFTQINIHIDGAEPEEGEKQNLVEVILYQEDPLEAKIRHLEEKIAAGGGDPEVVKELGIRVDNVEKDLNEVVDAIAGTKEEK